MNSQTYFLKKAAVESKAPSLRSRLFMSYLLLLAISFTVLVLVSLFFLSSRPAPSQLTWQRLELLLPALSNQPALRNLINEPGRATNFMNNFAETNDVRVMMLRIDGEDMQVIHDTAAAFSPQQAIEMRRDVSHKPSRVRALSPNAQIVFGDFANVDEREWLYAGIYWDINLPRVAADALVLVLAEERPTASLQNVLTEFGSSFLPPLIQAALVGGVVAFILALLISRNIAQPLQALVQAAASVAQGHFDEIVPEKGPREVRSLAFAFNRMSAEVRGTQESQRDFLANVSHDLKTPLTSIQGYSQAIMDGAARNPSAAAQIIHDEAERLNRMVTELTDLARLQAGRLSMKLTALDLSAILAAIAQRLMVVAQKKNIQIYLNTAATPQIAGDGDRLVQVFTNLISNAIKYTPEGGKIWLSTGVKNGHVEIIVKDNGIGIPQADLPRIFERFYQVDKARGPERGTGLGLAITQEIVQAHGGTIRIDSAGEGRGTTVTVCLPSPQMTTLIKRRAS